MGKEEGLPVFVWEERGRFDTCKMLSGGELGDAVTLHPFFHTAFTY